MELTALERASYLEPLKPRGPGRRIYKKNAANIFPLLEDSDEEIFPKVYLRIKPHKRNNCAEKFVVNDEFTLTADVPFESVANNSLRPHGRPVKHQYKFSKIFGSTSGQKEVFRETCLGPLKLFLRGENCLLFAYGATGAGKTYTIQGDDDNPGVIPQSINIIFSTLRERLWYGCEYKPYRRENVLKLNEDMQKEQMKIKAYLLGHSLPTDNVYPLTSPVITSLQVPFDFKSPSFQAMKSHLDEVVLNLENEQNVSFSLWVSFYEIHNESIYDLLDIPQGCDVKRKQLSVGYINGLAFIKDITEVHVRSSDEAYQIYIAGKNNLRKAATNLNSESSRSHCVFSLTMVRILEAELPQPFKVNVFSFVDLAGSERVKKTLSVGDRLRESQNINTSLHVLSRCLSIIRDNQKAQRKLRVPFRDSKLTQIFQYALTGSQGIAMIVNITLDVSMYNETVNVLKFSALAREIVVEPPNNSSHFLSSTNLFGNKVSLMKFNDTQISSVVPQSNDCNHLTLIKELQKQLKEERERIFELQSELEREQKRVQEVDAALRSNLTGEFSAILQRKDDFWKNYVRSIEMEGAEIKEFYERKLKKKREAVKFLSSTILSIKESRRVVKKEAGLLKLKLEVSERKRQILEDHFKNGEFAQGDMDGTLRKQLEEALKAIQLDTEILELNTNIDELKDDSNMLELERNCSLHLSSLFEGDSDTSEELCEVSEGENEIADHHSIEACDVSDVISVEDSDVEVIDD